MSGDWYISPGTAKATEKPNFGAAVALSDDWLVVGDPRLVTRPDDPAYSGGAYVFARTESGYERRSGQDLRGPAEGTADMYGGAVAVEGSLIAVGASGYSNGAGGFGAVFIFRYDEATKSWVQIQILRASSPISGSFGSRLAMENGVLVVVDDLVVTGQDVASRDAHGLAHVYRLAGGTFAFEQTIGAASANVAGYFASGVALSEGRLAISERRWCLYRPCLGRPVIHVYERIANNWTETGSAKLPDEFVASVTLEPRDFGATGFVFQGRTILVAAEDEGSGLTGLNSPTTPAAQTAERRLGSVYIFDEQDDGWQFSARLGPDMLNPNSPPGGFGRNIAFDGDSLAIVSMYASDNTDDSQTVPLGQVHLYGIDCARVPAGAATTAGCSAK